MPKYNLYANRYFYHSIYNYLNRPYGIKRKILKILKANILMYTGISFVIRLHINVTECIFKLLKMTSKNRF